MLGHHSGRKTDLDRRNKDARKGRLRMVQIQQARRSSPNDFPKQVLIERRKQLESKLAQATEQQRELTNQLERVSVAFKEIQVLIADIDAAIDRFSD